MASNLYLKIALCLKHNGRLNIPHLNKAECARKIYTGRSQMPEAPRIDYFKSNKKV